MSPFKPTREDATRATRPEEVYEEALSRRADPQPEDRALGEGRESKGGAAGNQRHPPHVTENSKEAPVQAEEDRRPGEVEPLPANASGSERIDMDEVSKSIDPESAYEGRRDEDKDRPPSTRAD